MNGISLWLRLGLELSRSSSNAEDMKQALAAALRFPTLREEGPTFGQGILCGPRGDQLPIFCLAVVSRMPKSS